MKNKEFVISVTEFLEEHSISESEFKDRIEKLQISLLCRRPRNVAVHVSGSAIVAGSDELQTAQSLFKRHRGTPFSEEHDYHAIVESNIKFFSIPPSEWAEIIDYGEILKDNFSCAFISSIKEGLSVISAIEQLKAQLKPYPSLVVDAGFFVTNRKSNQPQEEKITAAEILIKKEDTQKILNEGMEESRYSQKMEWMSEDLAILNEASDRFIKKEKITSIDQKKELIEKIKDWLKSRFSLRGGDLLDQAAYAILPDRLYEYTPIEKPGNETIKEYPSHASISLIMINEAAKLFWKQSQESTKKYHPKKETIKNHLCDECGLTVKLAVAAASIISLKPRK
ncbi:MULTISPECIES: hypothetical protein [Pseudomonas]|jgi:hypothetical protein|uniref:Uncharacterized protein n=1 Tax=Pseudomonas veronii TaxID=76761 RepID=A0A7Y1AAR8_PSEVE|nr:MULTISPECIES: hypothetical protein [Pseudomonas]ETK42753.1 hypothetical protein H098_05140 [Pseudomonas fluorescens FH5]MDI3202497.1 hypothetical protein [Pseudomonas shahriarae]NMY12235.1 hypothetical protein [Pseudomonas veronii]